MTAKPSRSAARGRRRAVCLGLLACGVLACARAEQVGLRDQVRALAREHAIRVIGLDRVSGGGIGLGPAGAPARRLGELLAGYDYALVENAEGGVAALYIVGPRAAPVPSALDAGIAMRRAGSRLLVDAELHVSPRQSFRLRMMVDPTSDPVLLPDSLRGMLRLADTELVDTTVVVDGEIVAAREATLDAVSVGDAVAWDVNVVFVPEVVRDKVMGRALLERLELEVDEVNARLIPARP